MAYVPDEAIDRMNELSGNAFKLFAYFCRRASKEKGESYAKFMTICTDLTWKKNHLYEYRKELVQKGWISLLEGDGIKVNFGFPRPSKSEENKSENRTNFSPKIVPNEVQKTDLFSPENVPPQVRKPDLVSPKIVPDKSENRTNLVRKLDFPIRKNQSYNQTINQSYNQIPEMSTSPGESIAALPPGVEPLKQADLSDFFYAEYEQKKGAKYQRKDGDFVRLAVMIKTQGERLTFERWQRATENYFASEIGFPTLADLANRYPEFLNSAYDRFKQPKNTNGMSAGGNPRPLSRSEKTIQHNLAVTDEWLKNRKSTK